MLTQIVNVSDFGPPWNWLADRFPSEQLYWRHCSSFRVGATASRFAVPLRRAAAALAARHFVRQHEGSGKSVIVSHGPRSALYTEAFGRSATSRAIHIAFSFNFTNLPSGVHRALMRKYLTRVDRLVVASSVEREIYRDYFQLDASRIDVLLWSMQPPLEQLATSARFAEGPYICAIGSQARDYDTLVQAMGRIPHINLVLVASHDSMPKGPLPANVKVLTNVHMSDAMNVLAHSQFMVLPLRDSRVPCGHVTVVSAMHMGKAILATNSVGLHDYLAENENAAFCPPKNSTKLADQIDDLFNHAPTLKRLGDAGMAFARANCTEDGAVQYFRRFLLDNDISS